jgi:hypothetical protein
MSQDLGQLLLKALNALPPQEQGELLLQLLGRSQPTVSPMTSPMTFPMSWAEGTDGREMAEVFAAAQDVRAARRISAGTSSEPELKVLPVRLPVADYERLRDWSRSHEFSMAVVVRTLVERFLDEQERQSRRPGA